MIKKIQVFNKNEVADLSERIVNLKEYWKHRDEDEHPFDLPRFTLGAVAYIDAIVSYENYLKVATEENFILKGKLPDLYEKLKQALEDALELSCVYAEPNALPGFHIFGSDIYFEEEPGKFHHDRQDELIQWGDIVYEPFKNISFTLAIKLPNRGAGLILLGDQVPVDNALKENKEDSQILQDVIETSFQMNEVFYTRNDTHIDLSKLEFIKYEEGFMFIHSGRFTHAMAPAIQMRSNDMRITLQGHGIFSEKDNKYLLYW